MKKQRGAALMVMLAVLILGAAWWTVTAISNPINRIADERSHNAKVLSQAKQALLGWVAQNASNASEVNPGKLPCPEALGNFLVPPSASEGVMQGFCAGAVTAVGRLPWRSLGLDKPYDASGEVLWYVVSAGWKRPDATTPEPALGLNSNSTGQLAVDGQPNAVVAAIIAPGRRLRIIPNANQIAQGCATQSQARTTFPPADSLDYLDCQNITGASLRTAVVDNATNEAFNDQVVTITAAEVMAAIEGVVAKRIEQTVVPQLQAVYASPEWSASSTAPIFPYAARFDNAGTFNPDSYQGTFGFAQGLLPMTAQTCNTLTTGRCDSSFGTPLAFVQWTPGTFSATQTGGSATSFSADCSTSTESQIRCTITYSQVLCALSCAINATIRVQGDARNVGRTLKTLDGSTAAVAPTAPSSATGFALTAALRPDVNASARATYTGTLHGGSAGICGFLLAVVCSGSATVTIPITVFQDHALVNPSTSDAWYWFTANKWYEVTLYAVAASHLPSAATHNCSSAGDCLTLTGGSPSSNIRALVILAGRSLTGTARPNADIADYVEDVSGYAAPAPNRDGDRNLVQGTLRRTYNDRFVTVSNY
jgi:hypothetical protein